MDFGIFDHVDRNDLPLSAYYEARLKIVEAYDRAGFYSYHVAEHHATPLGMAPSPSVFLAAVAQRTKRLRFGPMVYALPLYHPLRMIEEICMLDQMSGGRIDIGFGRGASPIELAYFGENPGDAQATYAEALEVIRAGLTHKSLTHEGKRFHFKDVPMELEPKQKPHPPIWYGLHAPESGERAAKQGLQVICLDPHEPTRAAIDRFKSAWREHRKTELPHIGLGRFIVVAETDEAALKIARRAYPRWHDSFTWLFRHQRQDRTISHPRPADFDTLARVGQGVAGSPETVARFLKEQHALTGANYCVGQFAFGDLSLEETLASIDLFVRRVMPALAPL
jgi:alkanesulfonate monooxygenase SsuD/methylene tetrahydromethanopterin reductase-like flavin-dependent oxidoreductase (luciferase family)